MSLEHLKIIKYKTSIANLPNIISSSPEWLKAQFDARTDGEVKTQHNALVDEVERLEKDTYQKGESYSKTEVDAKEAALFAAIKEAKETTQAVQGHLDDFKARRDNPHFVAARQTGAYTKAETDSAIAEKVQELGAGDMAKAVYDRENKGVVDDAQRLGGEMPSFYAKQAETEAAAALLAEVKKTADGAATKEALAEVKKTADAALPATGKAADSGKLEGMLPSELPVNMELLWENASPHSQFAAQTVNLNTDYSFFIILVKEDVGNTQSDAVYSNVVFKNKTGKILSPASYILYRTVSINNGNAIFEKCLSFLKYSSSPTVNNNLAVPWQIYGIK